MLQGDLGKSTLSGQPIASCCRRAPRRRIELTIAAMMMSMIIAMPLGILSATHVRGKLEWFISTIQSLWLAIPNFWAGILAIIFFSLVLRWLPPGGRVADGNDIGELDQVADLARDHARRWPWPRACRGSSSSTCWKCSSTITCAPRAPRA